MSDSKNFNDVLIKEILNPPKQFLFPFTPYGIQHDFMTNLYSALENKKLGIFESPTGTVSISIYTQLIIITYYDEFKYLISIIICLHIILYIYQYQKKFFWGRVKH